MRLRSGDKWAPFWDNLKTGHDLFAQQGLPPEGQCLAMDVTSLEPGKASSVDSAVEERCPEEVAGRVPL